MDAQKNMSTCIPPPKSSDFIGTTVGQKRNQSWITKISKFSKHISEKKLDFEI